MLHDHVRHLYSRSHWNHFVFDIIPDRVSEVLHLTIVSLYIVHYTEGKIMCVDKLAKVFVPCILVCLFKKPGSHGYRRQ